MNMKRTIEVGLSDDLQVFELNIRMCDCGMRAGMPPVVEFKEHGKLIPKTVHYLFAYFSDSQAEAM